MGKEETGQGTPAASEKPMVSDGGFFHGFSERQLERYSRHIILSEVGGLGQRRLLQSRVLIVGAGGLGSPCAYYLGAAGVGAIGIADADRVDLSNLQRQIIHDSLSVGRPKVDSAAERLQRLNPDLRIEKHRQRITSENALEIFKDYDVIIDGTDNFPARYLLNDACVMLGKPLVYGSILRFEGQLTTIVPGAGPCYRCYFPEPPSPGSIPSCREAGVLGVLPGVIGTLQATEAVKLILKIGELLTGRMMTYNALQMAFSSIEMDRQSDCPVCGEEPTITELGDYQLFCGLEG